MEERENVLSAIMHRVFDENLSIILAFDDEGNVFYLNETAKRELDYRPGEANIQDIFVSFIPEGMTIPEFVEALEATTEEAVAYRKNNTCFNAQVRGIRVEADQIYNIFSVLNIQYETHAKQELEKGEKSIKDARKSRNEFVANITHELRTPLNGIKGHVKELCDGEVQPEMRRTLNIILKCCENMEKIINNLLDFSKLEAGKFEITESPFDFRDSIRHVIDTSISIANEKGLKISAYVASDIPDVIIGDELRIVQILNNLVSNALKFTSIGYVNIEVYKTWMKHGRMELTFFVIDTGIGVTLEEKEKLFKSFSQADGSVTRKYGGTGLGLFVTKQLVELMHGTIDLESEKGKGSTFTFTIEVGVEEGTGEVKADNSDMPYIAGTDEVGAPYADNVDEIYVFGSVENRRELQSSFEKLLLCIEMRNWERAENFSDNIKQLAGGAEDKSIKSKIFKMQMAVRKEDYDTSIERLRSLEAELGF